MRAGLTYAILLFALSLKAQQLSFFKPDNLRQLPSSECYNIVQDGRGYIWFSTEAGLCRYNGSIVRVFNEKQGLPESATYDVRSGPGGNIWVVTSRNRVLYFDYKKDSLIEAPFSASCVSLFKNHLQQIYFSRFSSDTTLWLCSQYITARVNLKSGAVKRVRPPDSVYYLKAEPPNLIPLKINMGNLPAMLKQKKVHFIISTGNKKEITIPVPFPEKHSPETRVLTAFNKKGDHFIAAENFVIKLKSDLSWEIIKFSFPILNIYVDKDDGLWVCTFKGGVTYMPGADPGNKRITSLGELSVTGICEDAENGIWCTTLEKGIFYCRNKQVSDYSNIAGLDKKLDFLRTIGNHLFTSSEKSELFEIDDSLNVRRMLIETKGPGLTDIIRDGETFVVAGKSGLLKTDINFRKRFDVLNVMRNTSLGINKLTISREGRIFGIHRGTLIEIKGRHFMERIEPLKSLAKSILATRSSGLLLGCSDGLYRVNTTNAKISPIPGIKDLVSCILETHDNTVYAVTRDNGIYILKNNAAYSFSDSLDLATRRFSEMTEDKNGNLWITSNVGLIFVKKPFTKNSVRIYNSLHGLPYDEVLKVAVSNSRVYVSGYDGLCSFPLQEDLINDTPPPIYLSCIKVNGKKINSFNGELSLAYNENNLLLSFDVPAFKQASLPLKLFYQIISDNSQSLSARGPELSLNNLSPGNYKIVVYAANSDGRQSTLPAVLNFTIQKPFWQNTLFLLALILALISLTYLVTRQVIDRVRKKEEEKTRVNKLLAEYQMSALRAQMNPHFIFNCINSIQRYILTNKADEAYDYLSKFSKLIRLVLNYAEENLISLAQELEIAELYLELEQLRFENKFSYTIDLVGDIDTNELTVPVMIMQPYIENAIWHGLMNLEKSKAGRLHIAIELRQQMLSVVIEDNGIGIKKAALLRKKGHRSKGTHINNKRAEILNIMSSGMQGGVAIEEITAPDGAVAGTRVIINIPQNNLDDE